MHATIGNCVEHVWRATMKSGASVLPGAWVGDIQGTFWGTGSERGKFVAQPTATKIRKELPPQSTDQKSVGAIFGLVSR